MADSNSLPTQVMEQVQTLLQSIAGFENATVFVYDDDDLADILKGVQFPAVAIVYNGIRSLEASGKSFQLGISGVLMFSVIIVTKGVSIVRTDQKPATINLLNSIRGAMLGTRSVTGHFYHFLFEAPASRKNGLVFWGQRWQVPIQMTPNS